MDRQPMVAGQFYPAGKEALAELLDRYLAGAGERERKPTILAMVPHAGYAYSGAVAGRTLGGASLAGTLLLLGPNHTGQGQPLAVWPSGAWHTPLGPARVDALLASALIAADTNFSADHTAHAQEHSIEVVIPFLLARNPQVAVVPVAVAEPRLTVLASSAAGVAAVLKEWPEPVSVVVSSDMSHFLTEEATRRRDAMVLEAIERLDPEGLYDVVRRNSITMCGVLAMTLGLMIARELGARRAQVAAYATSAETSGDFERVVGYAGVLVS